MAVIDGTGIESRHTSRYYVMRRSESATGTHEKTYSKYPKVVLIAHCRRHLLLAAVAGRGPGSDLGQLKAAVTSAMSRAGIGTLLRDADCDAQRVHAYVRSSGIRTVIPVERRRPSNTPPTGTWRRRMRRRLYKAKYGRRW